MGHNMVIRSGTQVGRVGQNLAITFTPAVAGNLLTQGEKIDEMEKF